MKFSFSRYPMLAALSAALLLTACGGGKATFDVKGEVVGVQYTGLVLTNVKNGDTLNVPVAATTFKFGKTIEYGEEYDVQILNNANPLHQNCQVFNGKDTAGRLATINIGVSCALNERALGGKVSGLTTDGLILTNGSDEQLTVVKGATMFAALRRLLRRDHSQAASRQPVHALERRGHHGRCGHRHHQRELPVKDERGDISGRHNGHSKDKLDLFAAPQHTGPVSSNSPQKRIGF